VDDDRILENSTAEEESKLYLTKPLGVGVLTTAQKKGLLEDEHQDIARDQMIQLNKIGAELGEIKGVNAVTDVTGFGLLGHLVEMCEGANLSAEIDFSKVPKLPMLDKYLAENTVPGGTNRNWDSYGSKVKLPNVDLKNILCDPQTSGGLLLAVSPDAINEVQNLLKQNKIETEVFGEFTERKEILIDVK